MEVRYCPTLLLKRPQTGDKPKKNPFLPPEPALVLTPLGQHHTLLFNKYCVVRNHLLIISNEFIPQERPLGRADFEACRLALSYLGEGVHAADADWMFFYNSGPESGASQPHRHLQLIPDSMPPLVPPARQNVPALAGRLHFFASGHLDWYDAYVRAVQCAGLSPQDPCAPSSHGTLGRSYSLCFTRRWMLLVPREHERFEGISFNALAIVGYLLAVKPEQLTLLRDTLDLDLLFSAITYDK